MKLSFRPPLFAAAVVGSAFGLLFFAARLPAQQVITHQEHGTRSRGIGQVVGQANIRVIQGQADEEDELEEAAEKLEPAESDTLEFADGHSLHGKLEALDSLRRELSWGRDDASAPLTFATAGIRSLSLARPAPGVPAEPAGHATVKLSGGNWLTADVLGMQEGKVEMKLAEGPPFSMDRGQIEWIYFARGPAPECYDGPTNISGWISGGGWTYLDGALHASSPTVIGRSFESLPDKVEYLLEIDQGPLVDAFTLMLHGRNILTRAQQEGAVQLMFLGSHLQMVAQIDGSMHVEQIELPDSKLDSDGEAFGQYRLAAPGSGDAIKPQPRPFQLRVLEDRPAGRILILINGRKAADWPISKAKQGENRGGFSFLPLGWNSSSGQALSRIRVIPWDGRVPDGKASDLAAADQDLVSLSSGELRSGQIESFTGDSVKLRTPDGVSEVPREQLVLMRFKRPENPPDEDPPTARVSLAQRGEFDVESIRYQDGKFLLKTPFSGEMTLAPVALRELGFSPAPAGKPQAADEIVFRNGDRLRGSLEAAGDGRKLRWQIGRAGSVVEFDTARMAGVLLAPREEKPAGKCAAFVRFRNGDLIAASAVSLDKDRLTAATPAAVTLGVPRDHLQAVYFSADGQPPVVDGAAGPETCEGGPVEAAGNYARTLRNRPEPGKRRPLEPWRYFNGSFTLPPSAPRTGSLSVAPLFEAMPQSVEFTFDVTSEKGPASCTAQLFASEKNAGYLMQVMPQGLFIYDMQPRQRAGRVAQEQFQFGKNVKLNMKERHLHLYADRPSGKLVIEIDGIVAGEFGIKGATAARDLGHGIMLTPQPGSHCTFSNLWIGPWTGQTPKPGAAPADSALLANGDETQGTIQAINSTAVKMDCDIGAVDLPAARVTMLEFGGKPAERSPGIRLRFAGLGILTAKSFQVQDGAVTLQSALAGELKLPFADLRELVFAPASPAPSAPAEKPKPAAKGEAKAD